MNPYILAIYVISVVSVFIPLTAAVIQWKKLPKELSPLRWLLSASFVSDVLMYVTAMIYRNSYPVGNTYLIIQFFVLLYIFSLSLFNKNKKYALFLGIAYIIFYVLDVIFLESFMRLTTHANVVSSLIVIILSLWYLYKLLNELLITDIQRLPMLWITFAALLYYGCTIFIVLANNWLLSNAEASQLNMWIVHNFFNITKNILFAIALWKNFQIVRSSTLS
jgi:hypothetical protein